MDFAKDIGHKNRATNYRTRMWRVPFKRKPRNLSLLNEKSEIVIKSASVPQTCWCMQFENGSLCNLKK